MSQDDVGSPTESVEGSGRGPSSQVLERVSTMRRHSGVKSKKIVSQLQNSVDEEVRVFTTSGTNYRGTVREVTDVDLELVDVKACDGVDFWNSRYSYPPKVLIMLEEITIVEGGVSDREEKDWLER